MFLEQVQFKSMSCETQVIKIQALFRLRGWAVNIL